MASTLELAGKLEEALDLRQQALAHRLAHLGPDDFFTNRARLDLARLVHRLGRKPEATTLLQELQLSMGRLENPDDVDRALLAEAEALLGDSAWPVRDRSCSTSCWSSGSPSPRNGAPPARRLGQRCTPSVLADRDGFRAPAAA